MKMPAFGKKYKYITNVETYKMNGGLKQKGTPVRNTPEEITLESEAPGIYIDVGVKRQRLPGNLVNEMVAEIERFLQQEGMIESSGEIEVSDNGEIDRYAYVSDDESAVESFKITGNNMSEAQMDAHYKEFKEQLREQGVLE